MEIKRMKVNELKFAPYNPRKISKTEYQKLKTSIQKFGLVDPLIVNKKTMHVIGGNQRLKVLKDLGYKTVDVVLIDLDEEEEKALNLALNKISGEWDIIKLKSVLEEISSLWEYTGFDFEEIEDLIHGIDIIEPPDELFTEPEQSDEILIKVWCPREKEEKLIEFLEDEGLRYKK